MCYNATKGARKKIAFLADVSAKTLTPPPVGGHSDVVQFGLKKKTPDGDV